MKSHIKITKDYWNERATTKPYDSICSNEPKEKFDDLGKRDLQYVKEFLNKDMIIMDYGCGIGRVTKFLREYVKKVVAVDPSTVMLQKAKLYLGDLSNVDLVEVNSKDLSSFNEESFDLVYSFLCHQHIPRKYVWRIVEEWYRILKTNAILFFQTAGKHSKSLATDDVPDDNVWRSRKYDLEELRDNLERIGFKIIKKDKDINWWFIWCQK